MLCDINELSNRNAMGLPSYFENSILASIEKNIEVLRSYDVKELMQVIDSSGNILDKFAAGTILGLVGDQRIRLYKPEMITIPHVQISIGIDPNEIASVVNQYKGYGVKYEWIEKESPRFMTNIESFKIGKYLVTNCEYKAFLEDTQYDEIPSSWEFGVYPYFRSNHPVYTISENAADAYVEWLSSKTGRKFRLPTEYEWEYTAKGINEFVFPWGNEFNQYYTNTLELNLLSSSPVGIFPEGNSPFGVTDMAGNVEEYVSTDYHAYPGGKIILDDLQKSLDSYRICRGGSFTRYADLGRTTRRHGRYNKDIYVIGFRLAEDI